MGNSGILGHIAKHFPVWSWGTCRQSLRGANTWSALGSPGPGLGNTEPTTGIRTTGVKGSSIKELLSFRSVAESSTTYPMSGFCQVTGGSKLGISAPLGRLYLPGVGRHGESHQPLQVAAQTDPLYCDDGLLGQNSPGGGEATKSSNIL